MNVSNARPLFYCDCGAPSNLLGFTLLPVSLEYRTGGLDPIRIYSTLLTCCRSTDRVHEIIIIGVLSALATTSGQSKMFVVLRIQCQGCFQL